MKFVIISFVALSVFWNPPDLSAKGCSLSVDCFCSCIAADPSADIHPYKIGNRHINGSKSYKFPFSYGPCMPNNRNDGIRLCWESNAAKCKKACLEQESTLRNTYFNRYKISSDMGDKSEEIPCYKEDSDGKCSR